MKPRFGAPSVRASDGMKEYFSLSKIAYWLWIGVEVAHQALQPQHLSTSCLHQELHSLFWGVLCFFGVSVLRGETLIIGKWKCDKIEQRHATLGWLYGSWSLPRTIFFGHQFLL